MPHLHKGDHVKVTFGDSILSRDMAGCEGVVEDVFLTTANLRFPCGALPEKAKLFCGSMAGPYNFSRMDLEKL